MGILSYVYFIICIICISILIVYLFYQIVRNYLIKRNVIVHGSSMFSFSYMYGLAVSFSFLARLH